MIWWCLPRQPPLKPLLSKIAWIDTASGLVSRLIFLNQVSLSVAILPFAATPVFAKHLGFPMLFGRSKHDSFVDVLYKVEV